MLLEKKLYRIVDNGFANFKFRNIESFLTQKKRMKKESLKILNDDLPGSKENFENIKTNMRLFSQKVGLLSRCLHMSFVKKRNFNLIRFYQIIIILLT